MKRHKVRLKGLLGLLAAATAVLLLPAGAAAIVAGAGFTSDNPDVTDPCLNGPPGHTTPSVNCNIYDAKEDVWLNGGPSAGQNHLTDGTYVFAVLEPSGQNDPNDGGANNLSDTDPAGGSGITGGGDSSTNRQFTVVDGKSFDNLGTHGEYGGGALGLLIQLVPYDTTSNPGGVYILAICKISDSAAAAAIDPTPTVEPSACKYDAFKVRNGDDPPPPPFGVVSGLKYYDANANGQLDGGEAGIANWPINFTDGSSGTILTDSAGEFSASFEEDTYTFAEGVAAGPWMQTGNTVDQTSNTGLNTSSLSSFVYTIGVFDGGSTSGVNFGNLCVGGGGGLTLGFWSNKNGQALVGGPDIDMLVALNLRNANGSAFDPANAKALATWLLKATATNMAYMLSAQLAAMELNVFNGFVDGNALIYAPGATSANAAGFATVDALMAEANTSLGTDGYTVAAGPVRTYQEALKNALDKGNNNLNFVQDGASSCPTPVFAS
jgi:hypothetical protein